MANLTYDEGNAKLATSGARLRLSAVQRLASFPSYSLVRGKELQSSLPRRREEKTMAMAWCGRGKSTHQVGQVKANGPGWWSDASMYTQASGVSTQRT
jgi:hypothetical protein